MQLEEIAFAAAIDAGRVGDKWKACAACARAPAPHAAISLLRSAWSSDLGRWDSSLLVFLSSLREMASRDHIEFDQSGPPAATRRLLTDLSGTSVQIG